jgi:hypothetical protein
MRPVLLVLALLTSSVPAIDAKCAMPTRSPALLTPATAEVPAGTGVLVHTAIFLADQDEGEAFQPTWVWKDAKGSTKPTVMTLAPGLVVYALPANVTSVALFDGTQARATVTVGPISKTTLTAPDIESIGHTVAKTSRGDHVSTTVTLTAPVPADAKAVIVYDAKTKRALSYGEAVPGETTATVYDRSRCGVTPDGTVVPKVKQKVIVRFVDQFGRLSPASKPTAIKKIAWPAR